MKYFLKKIAITYLACMTFVAQAQVLPTVDLLGSVQNNTPNQFADYSFNFTAATTGSNYVGFAFRQDPAYWTFGNVSLTAQGSNTNLLSNGNMATGGNIPNGSGLQAPTGWGVWYQTGTPPTAAGTWQAPGQNWQGWVYNGGQGINTGTAGSWIDGAVGAFDGIYQGVYMTSGTTYTISFTALSNDPVYSSVQLGAYAGECSNVMLAPAQCTMRNGSGFTTLASPTDTATIGATVVSSSTSTSTSTSTSNGTATVATTYAAVGSAYVTVAQVLSRQNQTSSSLSVNQNLTTTSTQPSVRTVTTTTPIITTTTTTTYQTDTYSNGAEVTTQTGQSTSTSTQDQVVTENTNVDVVTVGVTNTEYSTRIDQMSTLDKIDVRVNETLLSDPLNRNRVINGKIISRSYNDRDWHFYINGAGGDSNTVDGYSYRNVQYGMGIEKRVNNTTLIGAMFNRNDITLNGNNGNGTLEKNSVGVYGLKTWRDWIAKADLGFSANTYKTSHSIPELGLSNTAGTTGNDGWAAVRLYTPNYYGFRPFVNVRADQTQRNSTADTGSQLTAVNYSGVNNTVVSTGGGMRYDYQLNRHWGAVSEVTYNSTNTMNYMAGMMYSDKRNSSVLLRVGRTTQQGVQADMIQAQLRLNF